MLFKYKILAFVSLFKKHRKNSIIFKDESNIELAKKLGISYNSFKKYYSYCISKKILTPYGDNLQFVKLTKVFFILGLELNKYHVFHWKRYEELNIKNIYNEIQEQILLLNFKQQQFRLKKKKKEIDTILAVENSKKSHPKKVKSLIKKYGSFSKAKSSISKKYANSIVSGKFHTSKLIGCSPSTGLNILRRMNNVSIRRTIISEKLNIPYTFTSFDNLKKDYLIIPSEKKKCFFVSKGSTVEIL